MVHSDDQVESMDMSDPFHSSTTPDTFFNRFHKRFHRSLLIRLPFPQHWCFRPHNLLIRLHILHSGALPVLLPYHLLKPAVTFIFLLDAGTGPPTAKSQCRSACWNRPSNCKKSVEISLMFIKQRPFYCVNTPYLKDDSYCPASAGPAKRQKETS